MRLHLGLLQMSHWTVGSDTKFSHVRPAVMRSCVACSLSYVGNCDDVAAVTFWNCGDDRSAHHGVSASNCDGTFLDLQSFEIFDPWCPISTFTVINWK